MKALALAALFTLPASAEEGSPAVLTGIDVLQESSFRELQGKSVGLITNQTGVDAKGTASFRILAGAPGVSLDALFSPEHGFAGVSESSMVASGRFLLPGGRDIPLFSLYGSTKAPERSMLSGLDVLVFDIQDIGARFYTYSTTMAKSMEAAAALKIPFIVLDRPNPLGGAVVEGPVLEDDPALKSFISYIPVPIRHGMTMGEIARLYNFHARLGAELSVIPLKGWKREMWGDKTGQPWVRPSPNMPDLDSAVLYPGIGCFESSNLSVGRGTPIPFRWIGAPWLKARALAARMNKAKLPGLRFRAKTFTPSKSVFKGEKSRGVEIIVTDRDKARSVDAFVHFAVNLRDLHPGEFELRGERVGRMTGMKGFFELYEKKVPPSKILDLFDKSGSTFHSRRTPFLLY